MRTLCRICGWPLIGTFDRCPWCEAVVTQWGVDTIPLEMAEAAREDDQAWMDHMDEQRDRRLVAQGVG